MDDKIIEAEFKCVYCIVPTRTEFVKIGRWKGSISNLYNRYVTPFGRFEMHVFQVEDDIESEKNLFELLKLYRWVGELFEKQTVVVDLFSEWCLKNAYPYVIHVDLPSVYEKIREARQSHMEIENLKCKEMEVKVEANVIRKSPRSRTLRIQQLKQRVDSRTLKMVQFIVNDIFEESWEQIKERKAQIKDPITDLEQWLNETTFSDHSVQNGIQSSELYELFRKKNTNNRRFHVSLKVFRDAVSEIWEQETHERPLCKLESGESKQKRNVWMGRFLK